VLAAEDLDPLLARLRARGRACYAVVDPEERDAFFTRFAATRTVREARLGRLLLTRHGAEVLAFSR
jgi:hypothetical protein